MDPRISIIQEAISHIIDKALILYKTDLFDNTILTDGQIVFNLTTVINQLSDLTITKEMNTSSYTNIIELKNINNAPYDTVIINGVTYSEAEHKRIMIFNYIMRNCGGIGGNENVLNDYNNMINGTGSYASQFGKVSSPFDKDIKYLKEREL